MSTRPRSCRGRVSAFAAICLATLAAGGLPAQAAPLPDGFVFLREIVPDIRQDMRYATRNNFMRRRLPGYEAADCVLTEAAARALGRVQNAAVARGLSLVVFDCYRPRSAVAAMVDWVHRGKDRDPAYFPNVARRRLIDDGYIGTRSSHSRGSTVDVGLETLDGAGLDGSAQATAVCARSGNETAGLGTPFDCFDPASRTGSTAVPRAAQSARRLLVELMGKGRFRNYPGEWWHFTLEGEPYPDRAFDFPVRRR